MLKLKNMTLKNFMSIGNVSQGITFNGNDLVLVLGENLDQGGNDNRNGTGKSTILNALSYVLYGSALTKIKHDNLINKINSKNMLVTLDFDINNVSYRIERGRKPRVFNVLVNNSNLSDGVNESQGDSGETQKVLDSILGIKQDMFRQIVGLNTYSDPFLSLSSGDQRAIIEQLLGITKLSEKASILKDIMKNTSDAIKDEEVKISSVEEYNRSINITMAAVKQKSSSWEVNHRNSVREIKSALNELTYLDIAEELKNHSLLDDYKDIVARKASIESDLSKANTEIKKHIKLYNSRVKDIEHLDNHICPTCDQSINKDTHGELYSSLAGEIKVFEDAIVANQKLIDELSDIDKSLIIPAKPTVYYSNIAKAYEHKSLMSSLESSLARELEVENPYSSQIVSLSDSIKVIDYSEMNKLTLDKSHQDFLYKLLVNKDSFVRKKIIDQNLMFLNKRLSFYLERVGLPHIVTFKSDLDVEINDCGSDLDFDNLSRGEKTRLILSLSWAFRDVFESLNMPIDLMFIDELIDLGLDGSGVDGSLAVLKQMVRDTNRSVYVVSHREDLINRIPNVLKVIKEGGFTNFSMNDH